MSTANERRRSRWAVSIAFTVIVVLLLAVAMAALGYMRIKSVKGKLEDASDQTRAYFSALETNPKHAGYYLKQADKALDRADKDLARPPYPQVEWVPSVGANVVAVRKVVGELDAMVEKTGPTLTKVATVIDFKTGKPRSHDSAKEWGQALKNAKEALKQLPDALEEFNDSADRIGDVNTDDLFPPVRDPLVGLQEQVSGAQKNLKAVSRATNTLAPVLKAIP